VKNAKYLAKNLRNRVLKILKIMSLL